MATTVGQVKWFNNKAGYGFITIMEEDGTAKDIFCHYTNLLVDDSQYKYLVQGEYVQFVIAPATGAHEIQATQITGINGGQLMCQTRKLNAPVESRPRRQPSNKDRAPAPRRAPLQRTASTTEGEDTDGFKKVSKTKRKAT